MEETTPTKKEPAETIFPAGTEESLIGPEVSLSSVLTSEKNLKKETTPEVAPSESEKAKVLKKLEETITKAQKILEKNKIKKEALLKELASLPDEKKSAHPLSLENSSGLTSSMGSLEKEKGTFVGYDSLRNNLTKKIRLIPGDSGEQFIMFNRGENIHLTPAENFLEGSDYFHSHWSWGFECSDPRRGDVEVVQPLILKRKNGEDKDEYEIVQKGILRIN